MWEIIVGAAAGAVVGWPGMYFQHRAAGKAAKEARVSQHADEVRTAQREAAATALDLVYTGKDVVQGMYRLRRDDNGWPISEHLDLSAYQHQVVLPLSRALERLGTLHPGTVNDRTDALSDLLNRVGLTAFHHEAPEIDIPEMAQAVLEHARHVCGAVLTDRPLPAEPANLTRWRGTLSTS